MTIYCKSNHPTIYGVKYIAICDGSNLHYLQNDERQEKTISLFGVTSITRNVKIITEKHVHSDIDAITLTPNRNYLKVFSRSGEIYYVPTHQVNVIIAD